MLQLERITRLHSLLRGGPVPLKRLQEVLELSRASVRRLLDFMRDRLGAPIDYDRPANGYYYKGDITFELPGLWFNASELHALLASEQLLESVQPGLLAPRIAPLRARIRKLLEQSGQKAEIASRIQILASARRRDSGGCFEVAAEAVVNGRPLDIEYHSRHRDETTTRRIHPYRLIHYRDNWYLVGHCERAAAYRCFSVDRLLRAAFAKADLKPADETEVERYVTGSFGIFGGEARAWAILRFSANAARWVADEKWHPSQIGEWKGEFYELLVPYTDPRELLMDILKFGAEVEVVAPPELRDQVIASVREAAARYG